jgi:hypothetical protein
MTVLTVVFMPRKKVPAQRSDQFVNRGKTDNSVPDVFSKGVTIPTDGPFTLPHIWAPIRDAFKDFDLNAEDPHDWQRLLYYLAEERRRGNPEAWSENELCRLAVDFDVAEKANPGETVKEIYKLLVANERYKIASVTNRGNQRDRSWNTLKRKMPDARRAYDRMVERLATAKLEWDRNNPSVAPSSQQQAVAFAKQALEKGAAPSFIRGMDDMLWNAIFADPASPSFWRSGGSFWDNAEIPSAPAAPRVRAQARKNDELKAGLAAYKKDLAARRERAQQADPGPRDPQPQKAKRKPK